nr:MAG TPA: hypothetical protein [Caudoviricetes sp.]
MTADRHKNSILCRGGVKSVWPTYDTVASS